MNAKSMLCLLVAGVALLGISMPAHAILKRKRDITNVLNNEVKKKEELISLFRQLLEQYYKGSERARQDLDKAKKSGDPLQIIKAKMELNDAYVRQGRGEDNLDTYKAIQNILFIMQDIVKNIE